MEDSTITAVFTTAFEVEAQMYAGLLSEAGFHAQVRLSDDPLLANVVRQLVLPRYRVVVPNAEAAQAQAIIAEQQQATEQAVNEEDGAEEVEASEGPDRKTVLLFIGRLFIWLLLLLPLLRILFAIFKFGR